MKPLEKVLMNLATIGLAFLVLPVISCTSAKETSPSGYPIPDTENATVAWVKYFDKASDIPGRETKMTVYLDNQGGQFGAYEYRGKIFAFIVDRDRKYPADYHLLNYDCDNIFEIKIDGDCQVIVPECLKELE